MNSSIAHEAARAQHDERLARKLAHAAPRIGSPTRKAAVPLDGGRA
jgi:hypothetical protein